MFRTTLPRSARWSSCCTPAAAVLRDALSFPAFAFPAFVARGETDACPTGSCDSGSAGAETLTYRLPVDIAEAKGEAGTMWVITADVPGFAKEHIGIELKEGILSIDARRPAPTTLTGDDGRTVLRSERRVANLARQIRLPDNASETGVTASLVDGVLTVTVPQKPEPLAQKIAIG